MAEENHTQHFPQFPTAIPLFKTLQPARTFWKRALPIHNHIISASLCDLRGIAVNSSSPHHLLNPLLRHLHRARQIRREDRNAPILKHPTDFPQRGILRILFPSLMPWLP